MNLFTRKQFQFFHWKNHVPRNHPDKLKMRSKNLNPKDSEQIVEKRRRKKNLVGQPTGCLPLNLSSLSFSSPTALTHEIWRREKEGDDRGWAIVSRGPRKYPRGPFDFRAAPAPPSLITGYTEAKQTYTPLASLALKELRREGKCKIKGAKIQKQFSHAT